MSDEALAKKLGIAVTTLRYYRSRGCEGKTVAAIRKWKEGNVAGNGPPTLADRAAGITSKKTQPSAEESDLNAEEQRARIRKFNADAEARELKNAQTRGELYVAAEVERNVAELTGLIRVRLESIPDELQMEWPPELRQQVTQRLSDKMRLILTEMSQWRLSCDGDVSTGDSELPSEAEGEVDSLELPEHSDA